MGAPTGRSSAVGDNWVAAGIERCKQALRSAQTGADQAALLRSLIRLSGGRIDLDQIPGAVEVADEQLLSRFGIARTNQNHALRIVEEDYVDGPEGLAAALRLDPSPRQVFESASPDAVLLRLTEYPCYRTAAQKAAVRALLTQPAASGLMVSMPTGAGKSLLFQIAASFERETNKGACAIVITPTVSLALDHARSLSGKVGLAGSRALTGDTPPTEAEAITNAFRRGEVPLLLLSPEKALSAKLLPHLVEAARPVSAAFELDARLTHLFVDEAHIIETWGRSFRPDFQRLPSLLQRLREVNPELRAVLLSATLPDTSRDILRNAWQLGGEWLEVDARLPRYEHDVVIGRYREEDEREAALDLVIDRAPRPLLVYTTHVAAAEALHERLTTRRGYRRVGLFTGETGAHERRRIVERWADDEYDIIIATSAFGMGIDKSNVRSVIHACVPEGPARWYQEIGRASRDGGQGLAACLFVEGSNEDEVDDAYKLALGGWLSRELAQMRWTSMLEAAVERHYDDERMRMTINLDAFREGIRPRAGDWNRGWNLTLLTLLQRAGVIRVLSIPVDGGQPEFFWQIEICDDRALSAFNDDLWEKISDFRDGEVANVRKDLGVFVELLRHPDRQCVTRRVFELIEPRSLAPPCGRCPYCRKAGIAPPALVIGSGLEKVWRTPLNRVDSRTADTFLVNPRDAHFEAGFPKLIEALAKFGVEQFVVPTGLAARAAQYLGEMPVRLGLVLEENEWKGGNKLAAIASAVLLPESTASTEGLLEKIEEFRRDGNATLLIVARPERILRGRRLDQTLSRHAPYAEEQLPDLIAHIERKS
jgi:ATP-dependent DNA helicase RecQ